MANIGIFVGSSGGVTQKAAEQLQELLDAQELINMEEDFDDVDQFEEFDVLLIGSSTWGQGDVQRDWVDVLYEMENDEYDLSGKKVAFFGAGDQKTHGEHFVSALGKMHALFEKLGASVGYGYTSTDGFTFEASLALIDGKFCGLAFDDINEPEKTQARLEAWAQQLKHEWSL